ncbi:hypothetical protein K443DRAFT_16023 [Laccaria amethystina LaAM-08-1]|uniref:Sortilin N-terminal domain-containing protein n=1 Tax=Laccaria amethystina LaAM-08-1 TaxID=1095629 RepID=A0A0C9WW98_9AGAR|nr:hypothetical protein K443DRAFT_16023 [Laccaria amethystina LaAM-08-1]
MTYYTKEAFSDTPQLLLSETSRCQFVHSSKYFKHEAHSVYDCRIDGALPLAVDIVLQDKTSIRTLNRNDMGYVDYEKLYGVDGVGLANVVSNAEDVEGRGARKQLKKMITFDDFLI